jgi:L-threonylcarbamoyladenylate synthase
VDPPEYPFTGLPCSIRRRFPLLTARHGTEPEQAPPGNPDAASPAQDRGGGAVTERLTPDAGGIAEASRILAAGGLVAFPTETVYGLGADARSDRAVARVFEAKGRPRFNPLIVHVPDVAAARRIAAFDDRALRLASAFWPGPLTLVLPLQPGAALSPLVTAGLASVAVRVPAHPVAQALLAAFGGPLAAPSANPSGRITATRAGHVLAGLGGKIDAVLDGGACPVGLESTIVGLTNGPVILRPGGLPSEVIADCLGQEVEAFTGTTALPVAPGQLASHYAPGGSVRLGVTDPEPGEVWIGFGAAAGSPGLNMSPSGDLVEAAANLFHALTEADRRAGPSGRIAVAPVPAHGLGRAINDRLARAAAPR